MQAELAIFSALRAANVPEDVARTAAEAVTKDIDRRYEIHSKQLATRGDVEALRADIEKTKTEMIRAIADSQRWTITAVGIIIAFVAALQKLL